MPPTSVPAEDVSITLDQFEKRMSPTDADAYLKIKAGSVIAAIRRGEIKPLRRPGTVRCYVTPRILAKWIEEYW